VVATHGRYMDRHGDRRTDEHPVARNTATLVIDAFTTRSNSLSDTVMGINPYSCEVAHFLSWPVYITRHYELEDVLISVGMFLVKLLGVNAI